MAFLELCIAEAKMAQQEGLKHLGEEYYDIMLVGKTGQGKSTLADKLLIANPEGTKYEIPAVLNTVNEAEKVTLNDFSTWTLHEDEEAEVETHLKALVSCRASDEPHKRVNTMRDPDKQIFTSTGYCQVFSNDSTKIRIMDVPGFEDERADKGPTGHAGNVPQSPLHIAANKVVDFHVTVTRNIIRIQSALGMCFRRIVYFFPIRDPLIRVDAILKGELKALEYAFGSSIFKSLVAVATVSERFSLMENMSDEQKFTQADFDKCRVHLQEALKQVLNRDDVPAVPIIFISLTESCESILTKVQSAPVSCDRLKLEFNPSTCASCGLKIQSINGEKVACAFRDQPDHTFPYLESTCHPAFRRSVIRKLLGERISRKIAQRWPSYKVEYCIKCEGRPFEHGCMQLKQKYKVWWGRVYEIDHTSEVCEPVDAEESAAVQAQQQGHSQPSPTTSASVQSSATPTSLQSSATPTSLQPSVADSVASSVQSMDLRGGPGRETSEDEGTPVLIEYKGT